MIANHKSGFVNIIGIPNVGKSTLMNLLIGEKLSVINPKPQTTRHRILGMVNADDYQIVFSDTPGIINDPSYGLHETMNKFAYSSFEDADILILMHDGSQEIDLPEKLIKRLKKLKIPKYLVINKVDLLDEKAKNRWNNHAINKYFDTCFCISATHATNTDELLKSIVKHLPMGPAYFPKDQLTDKSERFFVSEIIRKNILDLYHQEIPYSTEIVVTNFKERDNNEKQLIDIRAEIYVERNSQKYIIIGNSGKAIKQLGIESRKEIEEFVGKQVFLELFVKVKDNWRDDKRILGHFGYK